MRLGGGYTPIYDVHLWTLGIEFYGSMMITLAINGIAALKTWARITAMLILLFSAFHSSSVYALSFIIGILMNEIQFLIADFQTSDPSSSPSPAGLMHSARAQTKSRSATLLLRMLRLALFFLGWYLVSAPGRDFEKAPFHKPFAQLNGDHRFWHAAGALLLIEALMNSPSAQWLFTRPPILYLGRISYALYLVHGNVRRIVLYPAMPYIWNITGGKETSGQLVYGMFLGLLLTWPFTIWLSDIFYRAVDMPSVRFARWLESKVVRREK